MLPEAQGIVAKPSFDNLAVTPQLATGATTPGGVGENGASNELRPEDALYEAESPDEAALVNCAKVSR